MSKLLVEFLHEQQEPFALEAYLLERGSLISSNYKSAITCNGLKNRRKSAITKCSKLIKAAFTRLVSNDHEKWKIKNSNNGDQTVKISTRFEDDDDKFSTTSVSNSCSETDIINDVNGRPGKVLSVKIENKQYSPVSVLENGDIESNEGSPIHYKEYNNGETSTSISPCKPTCYVVQELNGSNSLSQYLKNKRALQRTKQLMFDCVREVIENHRENDKKGDNLKKILGPEELWKIVCENVWLWSKVSINETNITDLLHFDFLAYMQEWSDFEQQKKDVSMEIGDAILDHVVTEIVQNFVS